jgi:hypothetical protein
MADSALSLDLFSLRAEVAYFLGKGRPSTGEEWEALSESDRRMIDAHIGAGLRMFYTAYSWSFLRPWAVLTLVHDTWKIDLPDDFGFCNGNVNVQKSDGGRFVMQLIGQTQIMGLDHGKHAWPRFYAISPKSMPLDTGQRFELMVWPTPLEDVVIHLRYSVLPRTITTDYPYPYGGLLHAETIREACLAAAETDTDDQVGAHRQLYMQQLEQSKRIDAEQSVADNLGYNGDGMKPMRGKCGISLFLNGRHVNPVYENEDNGDNSDYWRP